MEVPTGRPSISGSHMGQVRLTSALGSSHDRGTEAFGVPGAFRRACAKLLSMGGLGACGKGQAGWTAVFSQC